MSYSGRDPTALTAFLSDWLAQRVRDAGAQGIVLGLSGGIDSSVACGIAARALGPKNVLGVIMPIGNVPEDETLGREVGNEFGVRVIEPDLLPAFNSLLGSLESERSHLGTTPPSASVEQLATANLKPRLRMLSVYYYANLLDYLVLGTGNKAELTVGYFTKHGDSGVDLLLLGDLTKAEVRAVATEIGVPRAIIERPPSAGLWAGQTDEKEMGITYDQLDSYLQTGSSGDSEVDAIILGRSKASEHKRDLPPVARP
ncbi:MAG TPA: NAD(+) synthase [Longimicrobiaceae bacterium]|nr:NAD(+) synthase [Longimicrobiaceae bacterium]